MARRTVSKTAIKLPISAALVFGIFIPFLYRRRKTYGAGARQVAQESWSNPDLLKTELRDGAVTYTAKPPAPGAGANQIDLVITHSDGSTQTHRLTSANPPNRNANPPETDKVVITYDKEGRPTGIYIF